MTAAAVAFDPLRGSDLAECISCQRVVGTAGDPIVYESRAGGPGRTWCLSCAHRLCVGTQAPRLSFRIWVDDPDDREALRRFRAWVRSHYFEPMFCG